MVNETYAEVGNMNFTHKNEINVEKTAAPVLFAFLTILLGATVLIALKRFKLSLPYTVILFACGIIVGSFSYHYKEVHMYTVITDIDPKLLLQIFLPVLIFDSAFSMEAHLFVTTCVQCILIAFPGLLLCAALTALVTVYVPLCDHWSWSYALLLGIILCATDPVAVVALLKDVGISPILTSIIDGEAMLNDGVAIVIYQILVQTVIPGGTVNVLDAILLFCKISIGGPLLGFVMGHITVLGLIQAYNDVVVVLSLTLSSAYLTYYLAEMVCHVSGVLALVVLGVVLSANKAAISPQIEEHVHNFWEIIAHFSNTWIFVFAGVIIGEKAFLLFDCWDILVNLLIYVSMTIFRLLAIGILSPILVRIGHGLSWQDAAIITWGGLRGAVGLCLALSVSQDTTIGDSIIRQKILLHVSGIVILTLVVNGTTCQWLLKLLGMDKLSEWRACNVLNTIKRLQNMQQKVLDVNQANSFLFDADWNFVKKFTVIENPYETKKFSNLKKRTNNKYVQEKWPKRFVTAIHKELMKSSSNTVSSAVGQCSNQHLSCTSFHDYEELLSQARLQFINILKNTYFVLPIAYRWNRLTNVQNINKNSIKPHAISRFCGLFGLHPAFLFLISIILLIDVLLSLTELVLKIQLSDVNKIHFQVVIDIFVVIYLVEFMTKIIGLGIGSIYRTKWDIVDSLVLLISIVGVVLELVVSQSLLTINTKYVIIPRFFRVVRFFNTQRALWLVMPITWKLSMVIHSIINQRYFVGCEITYCLEQAYGELINITDWLIPDHQFIAAAFIQIFNDARLAAIREMADLQERYPEIAAKVKTRHAARHVLNNTWNELKEINEAGLIGCSDFRTIDEVIENKMQQLQKSDVKSEVTLFPVELLNNVPWIGYDIQVLKFFKERVQIRHFNAGSTLFQEDDIINNVYIIISGIIKVYGKIERQDDGYLPNVESFDIFAEQNIISLCDTIDFCELFTSGHIIGELGVLTEKPKEGSALCETNATTFVIEERVLREAMIRFKTIRTIMWRNIALRIAGKMLKTQLQYRKWSNSQIILPMTNVVISSLTKETERLLMDSSIEDVILIQGVLTESSSRKTYYAPCIIPNSGHLLNYTLNASKLPIILVTTTAHHDNLMTCFDPSMQLNNRQDTRSIFLEQLPLGRLRKARSTSALY